MAVVAHTHWDREWYEPFEVMRSRLVEMLDGALDLLESDPSFAQFHLDGQAAMVDDYLEVRPYESRRLGALISAGRLAVGPWYVLMDEFCVSAETIVRNLQLGIARCDELDVPPESLVGYLPDMFGHIAQMPQLLRQAGIDQAVVWRGVPAAVNRTAFWWEAPDGSKVRAEYLPVGYANGAFLPKEPDSLVRRVAAHEDEIADFLPPGWPLLLLNGGDHQAPQAWMPDLIAGANAAQTDFVFDQTSLCAYLAQAPTNDLPARQGELRSGARAPLLPGVLSNRADVKQAAADAEHALEKLAEPLCALWLPPALWPAADLDRAWLEVIRNSAHDSVCACSADEVGRAVLSRYDNAQALAGHAVRSALEIARVATGSPGPVIVNPTHRERSGLVEVTLAGADAPPGTQLIVSDQSAEAEYKGTGENLAALLAQLTEDGWQPVSASLSEDEAGLTVDLEADASRRRDPSMAAVMAEAWARAGGRGGDPLTVRARRSPSATVLAWTDVVPGWGWSRWEAGRSPEPVLVDGPGLDNGLLRVDIDPLDGTFALNGLAGQNRLVEEGDEGDTYNFSPGGSPAVADPVGVAVETVEVGPLRAVARVRRDYGWAEVVSDIELRAGERAVRVLTRFDNRRGDHRLRAHFPVARAAVGSEAGCAFATVKRGEPEGGATEPALATFPARRFVTAGGLTLLAPGLMEYELLDDTLALTLLRAVGVLARPRLPTRRAIAGPALPLRDAQMPGPQSFRYAVALDCHDPWALADELWTPLQVVHGEGGGPLGDEGSRLRLVGAEVSSLRRRDGGLEMRVFNPGPEATTVEVKGHAGWLVDLRGRRLARWKRTFELGPWELATARLDAVSLD